MSQKEDAVIEGIGRGQPPRAVSAGTETPRSGGVEAAPRAAVAGKARMESPSALSGIAADLAAKPPVDVAKVERLRAAIISGDYRADPDAIAAAMIALESVPPKA